MLKEIHGVTDDPPARRRWFHDDYFDLFVWEAEGEVTLFQLCYGVHSSDRALVWDRSRGFFHDGPPAPADVLQRFDEAAASLPAELRSEIRRRLDEFAGRPSAVTARRRAFRRDLWQKTG
jgi:hypothetical protein